MTSISGRLRIPLFPSTFSSEGYVVVPVILDVNDPVAQAGLEAGQDHTATFSPARSRWMRRKLLHVDIAGPIANVRVTCAIDNRFAGRLAASSAHPITGELLPTVLVVCADERTAVAASMSPLFSDPSAVMAKRPFIPTEPLDPILLYAGTSER